jgi:acetyltransferase-like isoleucine patch superfamily enzyme
MPYDYSQLKDIGSDVYISQYVEIKRPNLVIIGSHVAIDTGFYCTTQLVMGDYIHIGPYVSCIGGANGLLHMGHFTTIAAGSRLICASDNHSGDGLVGPTIPLKYRDSLTCAPIILEDFASLGTNVIVTPGVTLGEGSVVGANSLLKSNTEPWTIYAGSPAKPIKTRKKDNMIQYARELGYDK